MGPPDPRAEIEPPPPVPRGADDAEHPRRKPGRPAGRDATGETGTRDQIVAQARRLFMQRGYAGGSVGEVAAVGVTKPTLYDYFRDKEGLYAAMLGDLIREVGGGIGRVVESNRPPDERLVELAYGYFLHADATMEPLLRDTGELIGRERAASVWEAYEREVFAPLRRPMEEAMARGALRREEPEICVRAFLGLLDALTAPGGHTARDEAGQRRVAEALAAIFLDGTRPRT